MRIMVRDRLRLAIVAQLRATWRAGLMATICACLGCQGIAGWPGLESSEAPAAPVPGLPKTSALATQVQAREQPGLPKTSALATQSRSIAPVVHVLDAKSDLTKQAVAEAMQSSRPVIPSPSADYAISLETALRLAGAENPTIALAQEAVQASLAEQLQVLALLLPTLHAGMNYDHHWGSLQTGQGVLIDVDRQALYDGAGAAAVGAGTVGIPGVRLTAQLADAIYAPRAARQNVAGRRFDAAAVRNDILLEAVRRYFDLLGAEARLQALHQSQNELSELVRLTASFARTGAGREGDAERVRSEAFLLQVEEQRTQEEAATTSAELARLLDMDPAVRLHGPGELPLVQLVDLHEDLERLIQTALANRPDLAARSADVGVAETRLRQEQVRPFVPLISVGYSAGGFGGGSDQADTRFGHFGSRTDFDVLAVWSVENLGFGNWSRQRRQRALVLEAAAQRQQVLDQARREVAQAHAEAAARLREVEINRRRVAVSEESTRLELLRVRNLAGGVQKAPVRQIEALNSLSLLTAARLALVRSIVAANQAQFQLFVALGQPPSEGERSAVRQ
jgi:outer membrane protein TolC